MSSTRTVVSLFVLAVALAGCDSSPNAGTVDCRPGDEEPCGCGDGAIGSRTCGAEACDCRTPVYSLGAEPAVLDFGEVAVGERGEAQLRIDNPAPRAVRLVILFPEGPELRFSLPADERPSTVPAGGSVSFPVRFEANAPGVASATLRIETDDPAVHGVDVDLVGRVPGPVLVCTPAEVVLPDVWVGDTATVAVVCTNAGFASASEPARLSLDRLEVRGEGFSAAWRETPPAEGLAVGESAAIELALAGNTVGPRQGALIVGGSAGTVEVPLAGRVREWPACDVELAPGYIRFGIVEPGTSATLEFAIRNLRTDAPCEVRDIRLCEGTSDAFELLGGPYEHVVVPPAGELRVPVRFAPVPGADAFEGCIELLLSPDRIVTIPFVAAGAEEPCALIAPNDVDFGTVAAGRATRDRELQVINICSSPLVLRSIELSADPAFFVRSAPPPGTTIPPGLSASFTIAYRPEEEGVDVGAVFVFADGDAEPYMATLRGRGEPPPTRVETFSQTPRPKVDMLVVIDNGTSMAAETPWLAAELGSLADEAMAGEIDFHLAVTTTGLVAADASCPGGASGGEDGRLFPVDNARPRVLDRSTPNLGATWAANLAVGTCHTAPPQLLEAALRALTPPLSSNADDPRHAEPNDGNLGFRRSDAHLSILAISDRADVSPSPDAAYLAAFQGLLSPGKSFNFHAITGNRVTGCVANDGRSAAAGDRLVSMVERTAGGIFHSICDASLDSALQIDEPAFGFQTCFFLEARPEDRNGNGTISDVDGELEVRLDGTVLPSWRNGDRVWQYVGDQLAVCFAPLYVPPPGSSIQVTYYAW